MFGLNYTTNRVALWYDVYTNPEKNKAKYRICMDLHWSVVKSLSTTVQHSLSWIEITQGDEDCADRCSHKIPAWGSCPQSCWTPWTPEKYKEQKNWT